MKVLLDTNIVLDLLLQRDEFGELAKKIFIKINHISYDNPAYDCIICPRKH